jgi:hypothetical protein
VEEELWVEDQRQQHEDLAGQVQMLEDRDRVKTIYKLILKRSRLATFSSKISVTKEVIVHTVMT